MPATSHHQKLRRDRRVFINSLQKEHGPANTMFLDFLSPEFKSLTSAGWHFSFIRLSFTEGLIEKETRGERERKKKREREMLAV